MTRAKLIKEVVEISECLYIRDLRNYIARHYVWLAVGKIPIN